MATTETLALRLEADVSQWEAAFGKAQAGMGKLGAATDKLTKEVGGLGTAFQRSSSLFDVQIGKLTEKVKKQEGIWDQLVKKMVSAEIVVSGLGKAWQAAGDYLKGAFDRSKIDPALAGINQMRQLTEDWTTAWQRAVDRVLNTIAEGMYGDETRTRGGAARVSARESALRELRERGIQTYEDAVPGTLEYGLQQQLEQGSDYRDAYGRWYGQHQARAFGGVTAMQTAMGLTTAAIARDQGVAARGKLSPSLLRLGAGIIGDRYGGVQGQGIIGGIQRLWGPTPKKKAGGRQRQIGGFSSVYESIGGVFRGFTADEAGDWGASDEGTIGGALTGAGGLRFGGSGLLGLGGAGAMPNVEAAQQRIEELNAQLGDSTSAIGGSLAALTGGLTAAVDAAIAGNENIAKAALKGAAGVLRGIALQATGLAAFETAKAFVFPALAGQHLVAAAKMAGVAALTGALAAGAGAAAGGGGGGGGGTAPSSSAVPGGGFAQNRSSAQGSGGNTYIINVTGYTSRQEAAVAVAQGIREAEAAGRIRSPASKTTRYGTGR